MPHDTWSEENLLWVKKTDLHLGSILIQKVDEYVLL